MWNRNKENHTPYHSSDKTTSIVPLKACPPREKTLKPALSLTMAHHHTNQSHLGGSESTPLMKAETEKENVENHNKKKHTPHDLSKSPLGESVSNPLIKAGKGNVENRNRKQCTPHNSSASTTSILSNNSLKTAPCLTLAHPHEMQVEQLISGDKTVQLDRLPLKAHPELKGLFHMIRLGNRRHWIKVLAESRGLPIWIFDLDPNLLLHVQLDGT